MNIIKILIDINLYLNIMDYKKTKHFFHWFQHRIKNVHPINDSNFENVLLRLHELDEYSYQYGIEREI